MVGHGQGPRIVDNPDGWGPFLPSNSRYNGPDEHQAEAEWKMYDDEQIIRYPSIKLGRVCDFTQSTLDRQARYMKITEEPKKDGFELVDNRPAPKTGYRAKGAGRGRGGPFGFGKGKGKGFRAQQMANYQEGILGQKPKPYFNAVVQRGKGNQNFGRFQNRAKGPSFRDWSVTTSPDWKVVEEIMLPSLAKVHIDAKLVQKEDILWAGQLGTYDRSLDRLNVKMERRLERFEDTQFFNVSTSDDPMIQEIMEQNMETMQVAGTDTIFGVLMAARSSVYSWDIVISKVGGKLMFDKRDGSPIDFLTVGETANETPSNDDKDAPNAPVKLGQEATCINQNFSQMVLDQSVEEIKMDHPNPFDDDDDESNPAVVAYRYRKITLPGNDKDEDEFKRKPLNVLVRTEVNAKMPDSPNQYCVVHALNEYDTKLGLSWRTHLETQRGAVLAGELKNNAFKLGRWVSEALLSGCETMKIGYASRQGRDAWSHSMLGVQTYQTAAFAQNIGLTEGNVFGIIRSICDIMSGQADGKYLLLKDPTKAVMRLYELPWGAFESETDDDMDE